MSIAFISGTGLYEFSPMAQMKEKQIRTPLGVCLLYHLEHQGEDIYFLPRHGLTHSLPPHAINYRANIYTLHSLGVEKIYAFCAVGSMDLNIKPGSFVVLRQFIDMTWGREHTFAGQGLVSHVDLSEPYCPSLSRQIQKCGQELGMDIYDNGVYICAQGPRYETPAEIRAFASWGANLVGMTGVPEAQLAREAGLCYASLAVVSNYAAGIGDKIDEEAIFKTMKNQKSHLEKLISRLMNSKPPVDCRCNCKEAEIDACKKWPLVGDEGETD
ncbi:MAG: S-methyl-5'-thioinosine phosphorylase [Clostridiales bacterium]|jgi:5'-methylthioadenosine phosphorylase|nr:S-methyl-5'-thioinosine phosphorylase [Clostridiales bacterium]